MSNAKDRGKAKSLGITAVRLATLERGYLPIPVNGKRPLFPEWQKTTATPEMIRGWERERPNDRSTGILTRIAPAIDIDILDAGGVEIVESVVRRHFADKGKLLRRVGKAPKCAFPFRAEEPFEKLLLGLWAPGEPEPKELKDCKHRIEILGDGQQMVVHGIHPDTNQPYAWTGGEPWTVGRDELPLLTEAEAAAFLAAAKAALVTAGWGVFETQKKEKTAAAADGLYPLVVEVASKLWGEPTHVGEEYRFGNHGSKGVNSRTGMWFDFENNVGGGQFELLKLVSKAGGSAAEIKAVFKATPFEWVDPTKIPKRQWLYRPHYIREFLSLLLSSGGKGKSSLLIVEACAMASGKPLLNIEPEKQLRVWYWNGEDPQLELQRRFAAVIRHYELKPEDLGDRLFIDSGRTLPIVIAEDERSGTKVCEPIVKDVIAALLANKIDVLIIDPFISSHRVSENDNSGIDLVAKSWSRIAEEARCAILVAHHTRKIGGERATVDDGRGASALRDTARTARTINTMTEGEAENAEIERRERGYYFRVDVGKANMTVPAEYADWFKLISVDLGNSDDGWIGNGSSDHVGVVTPFTYPVADMPRITSSDIVRVQTAIRDGGPWRADQRSKTEPWVGVPIAQALGLDLLNKVDRRAVAKQVDTWLRAGLLKRVDGMDGHHEARSYVEAGAEPVDRATTGTEKD